MRGHACLMDESFGAFGDAARTRGRDARARDRLDAMLPVVRCPLCRFPLGLRMGRSGPYFACLCNTPAPAWADPTPGPDRVQEALADAAARARVPLRKDGQRKPGGQVAGSRKKPRKPRRKRA